MSGVCDPNNQIGTYGCSSGATAYFKNIDAVSIETDQLATGTLTVNGIPVDYSSVDTKTQNQTAVAGTTTFTGTVVSDIVTTGNLNSTTITAISTPGNITQTGTSAVLSQSGTSATASLKATTVSSLLNSGNFTMSGTSATLSQTGTSAVLNQTGTSATASLKATTVTSLAVSGTTCTVNSKNVIVSQAAGATSTSASTNITIGVNLTQIVFQGCSGPVTLATGATAYSGASRTNRGDATTTWSSSTIQLTSSAVPTSGVTVYGSCDIMRYNATTYLIQAVLTEYAAGFNYTHTTTGTVTTASSTWTLVLTPGTIYTTYF